MRRKRHTAEQIDRKLRDADAQLAAGATIADVSKKLGVSENTFHRWRKPDRVAECGRVSS
jgi:transposase-like protein